MTVPMTSCHRVHFLAAGPSTALAHLDHGSLASDGSTVRVQISEPDLIVVDLVLDFDPPLTFNDFHDATELASVSFAGARESHAWLPQFLNEIEEMWYPLMLVDSLSQVASCDPADYGMYATYFAHWDGALVKAKDENVVQELATIVATALARWMGLRSTVVKARETLGLLQANPTIEKLEAQARALDQTRVGLARALVLYDARSELNSGYEFGFFEDLSRAWNMKLMEEAAVTALGSVSDSLAAALRQLSNVAQERQRRAAQGAARWLFIISIASGLSATFYGLDFVSNPRGLAFHNISRLSILIGIAVVTLLIGLRYRRTNLSA